MSNKQQDQSQSQYDPQEGRLPNHLRSDYHHLYRSEIQHRIRNRSIYAANLQNANIEYLEGQYRPYQWFVTHQIHDYQIVLIQVVIATFRMHLSILNSSQVSPLSAVAPTSAGNNAKIYTTTLNTSKIAIKSYRLPEEPSLRMSTIDIAIHQYCIMKICNALGCGPACPSYFGFDLLVFQENIQFSMEECEVAKGLEECYVQLLQELQVLHSFKIVHLDINSSNIMWSPTRGKNVFIDWGYSRIVKEEAGFKSVTRYRGTFQFVSQEMSRLFSLDQSQGFVDLYYNDLVCLQNTRKYQQGTKGKRKNSSLSLQSMLQEQQEKGSFARQPTYHRYKQKLIDDTYYLFVLLTFYAHFDQQQLKILLKSQQKLHIGGYGRKVIQLFKQLLPSEFYQQLVFQDFKPLLKTQQYFQFQQKWRLNNQKQLPYPCPTDQTAINKSNKYYFLLQQPQKTPSPQKSNVEIVQHLIKQLQSKPDLIQPQDRRRYYELTVDCLRFDKRNIESELKCRLAQSFLKFKGIKVDAKEDKFGALRQVFKCLLVESFEWPSEQCSDKGWTLLLFHCTLLEVDVREELVRLRRQIQKGQNLLVTIVSILYQYYLMDGLLQFKLRLHSFETASLVIQQLKAEISNLKLIISQQIQQTTTKDNLQVSEVFARLTRNTPLYKVEESLSHIQDQRLKALLSKILLVSELHRVKGSSEFSEYTMHLLKIKRYFKSYFKLHELTFAQKLYWGFTIVRQQPRSRQCLSFCGNIRLILNCDELYSSFSFKFYESNKQIVDNLGVVLGEMIEACFGQGRLNLFTRQFQSMLFNLLSQQNLREQNMEALKQLVAKYVDSHQQLLMNSQYDVKKQLGSSASHLFIQNEMEFVAYSGFFYFYLLRLGQPFQIEVLCSQTAESIKAHHAFDLMKLNNQFRYASRHLSVVSSRQLLFARYQEIINTYYWKYLQQKSICQQTYLLGPQLPILYFSLVKGKAEKEQDEEALLRQSKKLLIELHQKDLPFCQKNVILNMINIVKAMDCSGSSYSLFTGCLVPWLKQILIWGWNYHKIYHYMAAYFLETDICPEVIFDTVYQLWRSQRKEEAYKFVKDLIDTISNNPLQLSVNNFIEQMSQIDEFIPSFFAYQELKAYLGPTNRDNLYQLYCFGLSLLQCNDNGWKWQIVKEILSLVDMLSWLCKEHILSFYYTCLISLRLFGTSNKRKFLAVRKAECSRVLVQHEYYHEMKRRSYLCCLGLKNRQRNVHRSLFRSKILLI